MKIAVLILSAAQTTLFAAQQNQQQARQILDATGIKGGLVVHLGCGSGKLTAALHANDSYLVQGLEVDRAEVAKAREHILTLGLAGSVSVRTFDGRRLPYADALVNLLVADELGDVSMSEVMRVLAPRGLAFVGGKKTVRPWPKDMDEWTHFLHDASNNPVARDTRVGPPRRLRWKAAPLWSRSHEYTSSLSAMVSGGGRLFYAIDEGVTGITQEPFSERWVLVARDAFSGVRLWKRPLPHWRGSEWRSRALRGRPESVPRRIVASDGCLYATLSLAEPVSVIDPATGQTLKTIRGTKRAEEILLVQRTLVVRLAGTDARRGPGEAAALAAVDLKTGEVRWRVPERRYKPASLAADRTCLVYITKNEIVCRALADGTLRWRVSGGQGRGTLILHGPRVLYGWQKGILALSAKDGERLWRRQTGGHALLGHDLFVAQGLVWHADGHHIAGYDLETGEPVRHVDPSSVYTPGHHLRCYRAKATEWYLITQNRGAEFVSITGDPHVQNDWIRGACRFGVMPCNGMLYVPPHPCFCYPGVKLSGFNALGGATTEELAALAEAETEDRLLRGRAYPDDAAAPAGAMGPEDWPTYRHDGRRSGAAGCAVSPNVAERWTRNLGGRLTPPVVSGGRVYVAVKDCHTLHALDANDGRPLWHFAAGGRIDSAPTVRRGRVLFGCADGCVYCLRATDGALAWRFRAAPSDRQIVAFNQLESPWRVHGSVMVEGGVVYCTAGRSSFLDGGIRLYGLDPSTGAVRCRTCVDTWSRTRDDAKAKPFVPAYHMEGACSDILVAQDGFIYLGQYKFDRSLRWLPVPYVRPGETDDALQVRGKPYTSRDKEPKNDYEKHQRDWLERTQKGLVQSLKDEYGGWSLGRRKMGLHLIAPWGFLDEAWFNRTYWIYSDTWPGYYLTHRGAKTGQLLSIGADKTYAFQVFTSRNLQSPLYSAEKGYLLYADHDETRPAVSAETEGTTKGWGITRTQPPAWFQWVSVRAHAMVLAGGTLFVAGPPDPAKTADPMGALEGEKGAELWSVHAETGEKLAALRLESGPVLDGLIAAQGKLYLSTQDGSVLCLGPG